MNGHSVPSHADRVMAPHEGRARLGTAAHSGGSVFGLESSVPRRRVSSRTADVVANDAVDEGVAPLPVTEVRPPKPTLPTESAPL